MSKEENKEPFKGGYGNIRGHHNPKPFTKDYNGRDFAIWTEDKVHEVLDELEDWLLEEKTVKDDRGIIVDKVDKGNVFYKDFLFKKKLFQDWITYVQEKYTTVSKRLNYIDRIQEHKLQKLAFEGKGKENITKFILQNKYDWREKADNKIDQTVTAITWQEEKTYSDDTPKEGDK